MPVAGYRRRLPKDYYKNKSGQKFYYQSPMRRPLMGKRLTLNDRQFEALMQQPRYYEDL